MKTNYKVSLQSYLVAIKNILNNTLAPADIYDYLRIR